MRVGGTGYACAKSAIFGFAVAAFTLGCGAGGETGRQQSEPITVKEAPSPDGGTETVPECEGILARGECDGHTAVYCDLEREEIRRVDCEALGDTCLEDVGRGAICDGSASEDYDAAGKCEDGAAVWRDEDGELQRWTCADDGLTCQTDACEDGAYCCPSPDGNDSSDDDSDPCASVTCGPDTAHLSSCCGSDDEAATCEELGTGGECTADGSVRYCNGSGEIVEYPCTTGTSCEVGTCFGGGAECCDSNPADECSQLGLYGECSGNTARWCDNGEVVETSCTTGQTCGLDECGFGANCCDSQAELTCEDVGGSVGICDGDTLIYCSSDELIETDCAAMGNSCAVDDCLPGIAECC